MFWANFLHFYQPPDQKRFMMEKIANEGYRPLIATLLLHPKAKLTFNISGCLFDKLVEFGMSDVVNGFRELVKRGQVELTASAKYHPFLPLIKQSEVQRQIMINDDTLRYYLGDLYKPKGFFSPEAGYSRELAEFVAKSGYAWIIVDEIGYTGRLSLRAYDFTQTPGFYSGGLDLYKVVGTVGADNQINVKKHSLRKSDKDHLEGNGDLIGVDDSHDEKRTDTVDYSKLYRLDGYPNFMIMFRERVISDAIASGQIDSAEQFMAILDPEQTRERYLLTGTDGEAYGHHQKGLIKVLDDLLSSKKFKTIAISELPNYYEIFEEVDPISSTWGTSEKEISEQYYYSRWLDPRNKIHKMQWKLTNLAIQAVEDAKGRGDLGYPEARKLLDKALYSCHFWWATARPWWSVEIIERGAHTLLEVIETLKGSPVSALRRKAKRLYSSIIFTAFDWMRSEFVRDLSHQHK